MNHPSLGILQHPPSTPGVEDLGVALEQHRDTPLRLRNDNAIDEIDGIDNAIDDIDDAIDDIDDGDHGTLPWTSTNHVADVSNTTTTDTNNNMTTPAASPGDTTVSIQDSSSSFSSSSSSKESKDQDEPETTEYQLQKATAWDNKIAIGNVVYAPWPNHNNNNNSNNNSNKKSKYYWGTILARRSKGHYNIEFSDKSTYRFGRILEYVNIASHLTLLHLVPKKFPIMWESNKCSHSNHPNTKIPDWR
jgi:E3 ubiquitin-protein ligase DOA10